jgi:hypothetical protein
MVLDLVCAKMTNRVIQTRQEDQDRRVSKASYRSMGTTGDPVTGRPSGRTGEPLHRLEPVPVNHFTV